MRRRVIRNLGKAYTQEKVQAARDAIADAMRDRLLGLPQNKIDAIVDYIATTGWDTNSFDSFATQKTNQYRPPVQAFLFHHEHVLDELVVSQGVYTHFHDRADDPNFALRFPAETELIFRRMTPGDVYMLQAAQHLHLFLGPRDQPSESNPTYWEMLWTQLIQMNCKGLPDSTVERLLNSPVMAFFIAMRFSRNANYYMLNALFEETDLNAERRFNETFFSSNSPRDLGIRYDNSRIREGDVFLDLHTLSYSETDQHLWKACVILTCFGIDMRVQALAENEQTMPFGSSHFDFFNNEAQRHYIYLLGKIRDERNVNQTQDQPSAVGDSGEPGIV